MGILVGLYGFGWMGGLRGYSGDLVYIMRDWNGDLVGL